MGVIEPELGRFFNMIGCALFSRLARSLPQNVRPLAFPPRPPVPLSLANAAPPPPAPLSRAIAIPPPPPDAEPLTVALAGAAHLLGVRWHVLPGVVWSAPPSFLPLSLWSSRLSMRRGGACMCAPPPQQWPPQEDTRGSTWPHIFQSSPDATKHCIYIYIYIYICL